MLPASPTFALFNCCSGFRLRRQTGPFQNNQTLRHLCFMNYYSSSARPEQVKLCTKAAQDGDLDGVKEQVRQLLHSPDIEAHPAWLYDSLSAAIQRNDPVMVGYLLDENVIEGDFPAEIAVRAEAFDILELFLNRGWDINQPDRDMPPVLGIPLSDPPNQKMAVWLLDHGADPNRACNLDLTPMSFAMTDAPLAMIDMLFSRGAKIQYGQLLHHAVMRRRPGALELVTKLVDAGAPINKVKYEEDLTSYRKRFAFGLGTPLHRAAEFGEIYIVQYLLLKGADPLKLDSKGHTPRFWAERWGHMQVAAMLEAAEVRWRHIAYRDSIN